GAPRHRGGVDRDFVGAGSEQRADIVDGAHAAADSERHKACLRGAADDIEHDAAVLMACSYVQEGELIGARFVIGDRCRDRIPGIEISLASATVASRLRPSSMPSRLTSV